MTENGNSSFVFGIDSCNAWQGVASGWSGALILQNCPFAHWHVMDCCSKISMAFVSLCEIPKYLVSMSYHAGRLPLGMNRLKTW